MAACILSLVTSETSARFLAKVIKRDDGCWEWTAGRHPAGYGKFTAEKTSVTAHRFSFAMHHGKEPGSLNVCHACDNPWCVNPAHLFLGTQQENIADKYKKGRERHLYGDDNPHSRLTTEQVQQIRICLAAGMQGRELCRLFGVRPMAISNIKNGRLWKHLPPPHIPSIQAGPLSSGPLD